MSENTSGLLDCCLYFTSNALSRVITKMAERAFAPVAMAPSHAFLLMLAIEKPDILQKELAEKLHLAPSTVSRFVDALLRRGLVEKRTEGRNTFISPTVTGIGIKEEMERCWASLYDTYCKILGEDFANEMNAKIRESVIHLEAVI